LAWQSPALPSFGAAGDHSQKATDSRGKDASRCRCAPRHHCRFRPSKCPSSLPFDRPKKRRHNQGRAVPGAQAMITNWLPLHTPVRLVGIGPPPPLRRAQHHSRMVSLASFKTYSPLSTNPFCLVQTLWGCGDGAADFLEAIYG